MNAATKDELQAVTDKLSSKIDDKHEKMIAKWDGLADSINGLNVNIGKFLVKLDHQEKANTRLSGDIESLELTVIELDKRFTIVETKQNVAVGIGGKFMMPVIYAMFAINSIVAVASYLNK